MGMEVHTMEQEVIVITIQIGVETSIGSTVLNHCYNKPNTTCHFNIKMGVHIVFIEYLSIDQNLTNLNRTLYL